MRLLIAIPCMDTVRYEFAESLANLCKHLSDIGVYYDLEWHATSIIYLAREALADKAINDDYDYELLHLKVIPLYVILFCFSCNYLLLGQALVY